MGKGIALQFKESFPENFKLYRQAVEKEEIRPGKMFVYQTNRLDGVRYIINFPTKTDWYRNSKYEYIEDGLKDLVTIIKENNIKSIAIPPLGCGNGKLKWGKIKPIMEKYLDPLQDIEIIIFEPDAEVKKILQEQDQKKEIGLTAPRAMLLYALFYYETLGEDASLFVANKLSYLLQRLGEKQMRLKFMAHHYGPYSNQVDHLMYALNGKYLKGLEQRSAKAFDSLDLNYDSFEEIDKYIKTELTDEQRNRLNSLISLIEGFQSSLALEVLASVDYILKNNPALQEQEVLNKIHEWSTRKKELVTEKHVSVAFKRLRDYKEVFAT
jgi:O-acetyl-ADP-ribose deacetylase (regulator of RNase III)